jgi:hypothetical protein
MNIDNAKVEKFRVEEYPCIVKNKKRDYLYLSDHYGLSILLEYNKEVDVDINIDVVETVLQIDDEEKKLLQDDTVDMKENV